MIAIKRVYEELKPEDGIYFLVERLWPRGIKKQSLPPHTWLKEVAPSTALRSWFSHDPAKWDEFQKRYAQELDANPQAWQPIIAAARTGKTILLYSARDVQHNSALLLKRYLEKRL